MKKYCSCCVFRETKRKKVDDVFFFKIKYIAHKEIKHKTKREKSWKTKETKKKREEKPMKILHRHSHHHFPREKNEAKKKYKIFQILYLMCFLFF